MLKTKSRAPRQRWFRHLPITTLVGVVLIGSLGARLAAEIDGSAVDDAASALFAEEHDASESARQVDDVLRQIRDRESVLDQRAEAIAEQESALKTREDALRAALDELRVAQDELRAMVGLAQAAADADVKRLAEYYEKMKPKEAAAIFQLMDETLAAGFLAEMKPDSASAILSKLEPEKSYSISVVMAGRNVLLAESPGR